MVAGKRLSFGGAGDHSKLQGMYIIRHVKEM